jgi:hypothetical protein
MSKTRHIQARMSQRGIRQELVALAQRFGEPQKDKVVLGRKGLQSLLNELRDLERMAVKAMDKGGLVVVEAGDVLITAYNLDSYDRRKSVQV